MPSLTSIFNLALAHVGNSLEVQNGDTDNTAEARACRRFYEQVRDEVLRDFNWPFASRTVALSVVEANPTTEWAFAYRYPANCLRLRRIVSGVRGESALDAIPFTLANDDDGTLIYTDQTGASIEYTVGLIDPTRWPADFVQAVALLLASFIAPSVTAGDPNKLGARALQLYQWRLAGAQANAANEVWPDPAPDSEFMTGRM